MEGGGLCLQGHHAGPNNTGPATGSGSVQSLVRMRWCHDGGGDSQHAGQSLPDVSGVSLSHTHSK